MTADFQPLRIAALTVSDTRTTANDTSGDTLVQRLTAAGHTLARRTLLPDDADSIEAQLNTWLAETDVQVILITGGTGITARDVTPEAVRRVLDKELPGFGELFRAQSLSTIGLSAILSRALGGIAAGKYIFVLPGSPGAVRDAWDGILAPLLDSRTKPCNLVDLLPRV